MTDYAFGELRADERQKVGLHLIECETCWEDVRALDAGVHALRHDAELRALPPARDVVSVLGMSGKLDEPFAGHRRFAFGVALLYGLLHAMSVWTETAYSYDRFGELAWTLSAVVFVCVTGVLGTALWIAVTTVRNGQRDGLAWSLAICLSGLALITAVTYWMLPSTPTIAATFQTRSAAGGYLKNELLYFLPLLFFVWPTFHAVVALQGELRSGRSRSVLDLLTGKPESIAPRGVWLVPLWGLVAFLLVAAGISYVGLNNLLDHLVAGRYANLFAVVLHLRVVLWFVVAVAGLAWYQYSLNELKREAHAAVSFMGARDS